MLSDFEKLGYFYLGKYVDRASGERTDDLVLHKSGNLTTHAAIVGMTGSGKTGLGVALIEEALIDGIPVIAIDPKGDLGNLLLTFPQFRGEDFRPWVDASAAGMKGLDVAEYAQQQAELWRDGLAAWGQTPDRVSMLEAAADRCIYTPGSTAGRPLSMLSSFKAPGAGIASDAELLGERIEAAVSGLLTLLKIDADPVMSREHVLLANIFRHFWREGRDLDLETLIAATQQPPFEKIGLMGVETFFPQKDRFEFMLRINHLLAAPGFETWLEGDPLDAQRLYYTAAGRPRLSVISLSHLTDAERMFAVTSILNEVVTWMRGQSGTSTLRAILYVDEVFGFLPPVANPPSKKLFLRLLKQARAFGLSTILATQNPIDLDYKALSNAGTWFVGRLQTERDKMRLLEGMATLSSGEATDTTALSETISGLDKRQFVLHSVHERDAIVFETRWVMSYLAGPMTREHIKAIMAGAADGGDPSPAKQADGAPHVNVDGDVYQVGQAGGEADRSKRGAEADRTTYGGEADRTTRGGEGDHSESAGRTLTSPAASSSRPILPPEVTEVFAVSSAGSDRAVTYVPVLFAHARVLFSDARRNVHEERLLHVEIDPDSEVGDPDWDRAAIVPAGTVVLDAAPSKNSSFNMPPAPLQRPENYRQWVKSLESWLQRTQTFDLLKSSRVGLTSVPGESESSFRIRVDMHAREERDTSIEKVRRQFESRIRTLENQLQRAEHAVERESQQLGQAKISTTIAIGQTLLGAFLGGGKRARGLSSRAGTATRSASRIAKETGDVDRAQEKVVRIDQQLREMQEKLSAELDAIRSTYEAAEEFEVITIRPRSANTKVVQIGVLWKPD